MSDGPSLRPNCPCVLVAEDSARMREILVLTLSTLGLEIDQVSNGAEAFEHLLKQTYDLVITDLKMSPIDGAQLVLALQLLPAERRPKVIVCSSHFGSVTQTEREALRRADWLLAKPFSAADLITVVRSFIPAGAKADAEVLS